AWERTDTSGTQGYAIEVDNSNANTAPDGTPQPVRSGGGTVFYLSSQGSSAPTFATACSFTSQATYGTTCNNDRSNISIAINTSTITDPLNSTQQPAGAFFEVALDITGLTGIAPSCPGAPAASVYLRSITGQTSNGNLKGYMAPLSVAPDSTCVPPPITTTATPGGPLNAIGSTQRDTVTVGTAQKPGVGTVKFFLCSPADVANNPNGDCAAGGTQVGAVKALDANGQAIGDNVSGTTAPNDNALGKYCWRAEFTRAANDHNYLSGSETNSKATGAAGDECFIIVHKSPTIATQIAVLGKNPPGLGFTTLGDTATLSGYAGSTNGETVTFKLYGPFASGVQPNCTGQPAFTTTGTLNGGSATTSQNAAPSAAGTYVWVASYPGDPLNDSATGNCSDANESATIVPSQVTVAKAANPAGPVSAGDPIGFDITVTNPGNFPATGVHVSDPLPAGADGVANGDLVWSLNPANANCLITGNAGNQTLDCVFNQVDPGSLPAIHITSQTSPADCGTVNNEASVSATNGNGGDSNTATVAVQCPSLTVTKKADAATVNAGDPIGFKITVANGGPGTAKGVILKDPLPAGTTAAGWTIDNSTIPAPAACAINGAVGTQELDCTTVDLASGASFIVHISAATNFQNCVTYNNTATAKETNGPDATGSDSIQCLKPSLTVTKTADASTVNAGDPIGFKI
ncbi:MAG TPA: hypothetical protein VKE27_11505, partial [Candidatus Dormibacteraeota bacterium]|nr:hypothetical protein [Candidatus Dormibacteraeota bacterium]